jgi:hypothetical protein
LHSYLLIDEMFPGFGFEIHHLRGRVSRLVQPGNSKECPHRLVECTCLGIRHRTVIS